MRVLKRSSLVAAGLFLLAAVMQWNDPDPFGWIALYAAAAATSVAFVLMSERIWRVALVVGGAAALWAALIAPGASGAGFGDLTAEMSVYRPEIEVARELCGLLLVAVWMAVIGGAGIRGARK